MQLSGVKLLCISNNAGIEHRCTITRNCNVNTPGHKIIKNWLLLRPQQAWIVLFFAIVPLQAGSINPCFPHFGRDNFTRTSKKLFASFFSYSTMWRSLHQRVGPILVRSVADVPFASVAPAWRKKNGDKNTAELCSEKVVGSVCFQRRNGQCLYVGKKKRTLALVNHAFVLSSLQMWRASLAQRTWTVSLPLFLSGRGFSRLQCASCIRGIKHATEAAATSCLLWNNSSRRELIFQGDVATVLVTCGPNLIELGASM